MSIINSNCVILDTTVQDDIDSFSINNTDVDVFSDSSLSAIYTSNNSLFSIDNIPDPEVWNNKLISSDPNNFFDDTNIWIPQFILPNQKQQKVSSDGIYNKNVLGTNQYFTLANLQFKNLSIIGESKGVIPWKLNRDDFPFSCTFGILYWKKIVPSLIIDSWSDVPLYQDFTIGNSDIVNKKISDSEYIADGFPSGINYTSIQDNIYIKKNSETLIYVSEGDVFSYSEDPGLDYNSSNFDLPSKTYISSSLYQKYNDIYNALTINEIKSFSPRDLTKARAYKNLAKYLATSPFASKFSSLLLSRTDIQDVVYQYVNNPKFFNTKRNINIDQLEIKSLAWALESISNIIGDLGSNDQIIKYKHELFYKLSHKYGIKLLLESSNTAIGLKKPLKHGDSVAITQVYDLYTDNSASFNNKNEHIFLDHEISLNRLAVKSNTEFKDISINIPGDQDIAYRYINLESSFNNNRLLSNKIPLYDSIKPKITTDIRFNILMGKKSNVPEAEGGPASNPDTWLPSTVVFEWGGTMPQTVWPTTRTDLSDTPIPIKLPRQDVPTFKILCTKDSNEFENAVEIIRDDPYSPALLNAEKQFTFFWEQVSGPPLKFTDSNLSSDDTLYDTSTSETVKIYPSHMAKYKIKCTISSPFGRYIKYKSFLIIDGRLNKLTNNGIEKNEDYQKLYRYFYDENNNYKRIITKYNSEWIKLNGDVGRDYYGLQAKETVLEAKYISPNIADYRSFNLSGFKKIAINANGLLWTINTDYRVTRAAYLESYVEKLSGDLYKFKFIEPRNLEDPSPNVDSNNFIPNYDNSNINIKFIIPRNIKIYFDRIILENIRNNSEECADCLSTFSPDMKGYTTRASASNPGQKTLAYKKLPHISLELYDYDDTGHKFYSMPDYSLDYAPPIKAHGGYGQKIMDKIGASTPETDIRSDNLLFSNNPIILPSITGLKLDVKTYDTDPDNPGTIKENFALCYQKIADLIDERHGDRDSFISFTRGSFVPESGFINNHLGTTGSILRFNPGARDTFCFSGPSMISLKNNDIIEKIDIDGKLSYGIGPKTYSSTISIGISPVIQWAPECECGLDEKATDSEREQFNRRQSKRNIDNQINKEFVDQISLWLHPLPTGSGTAIPYKSYHGYRYLGGGIPRTTQERYLNYEVTVNDEFLMDRSLGSRLDPHYKYFFNVTGPPALVTSANQAILDYYKNPSSDLPSAFDNATWELRDPRVNTFAIKNIDVKLNFLNYVNTKDLAISLEVDPCDEETKRQTTEPVPGIPINGENIFWDSNFPSNIQGDLDTKFARSPFIRNSVLLDSQYITNRNLGNYLKSLSDINSNLFPGDNLKVYLLNQEHITNNGYNFCLKFSDSAPINNVLSDINIYENNGIGPIPGYTNNIIDNGETITPSLSAIGFNEKHINDYIKIIKQNKLFITNNSLSKFSNKKLFLRPPPDSGPCAEGSPKQRGPSYSSDTKFILKITIFDEEDLMDVYDNIYNNQLYTDFSTAENKETSSLMYNSLCNWETIVHVGDVPKATTKFSDLATYSSDNILSMINYDKLYNNKKYPSYNFIADFSDIKFLLPIANINAPYFYTQENNLCSIGEYDPSFSSTLLSPPLFPNSAIASILVGLLIGGLSGSMIGAALGATAGFNLGYEQIIDFLKDLVSWRDLDSKLREIWQPNYDGYPFGSPDKILLNISKDGGFWYNLEANIFRYDNTPVLDEQEFDFISVNKTNNLPELTEFTYTYTTDKSQLIDDIFIKYNISIDCQKYKDMIDNKNFPSSFQQTPNSETIEFKEGDILIVNPTGDGCDMSVEPRIYINAIGWNTSDGLLANPIWSDTFFATNTEYSTYNDTINYNNNIFDYENFILTENEIPFNIFKVGDTISVFNQNTRDVVENVVITSKAKIFKNNKYVSVFAFDNIQGTGILPRYDTISTSNISSSPKILVVFNYDNQKNNPINTWSFDKSQINDSIASETYFSTNSIGSYGDLSPKNNKNILSYLLSKNNLSKLDDIYNNSVNNIIKYNTIEITYLPEPSSKLPTKIKLKDKSVGFAYNIKNILENNNLFYKNKFNIKPISKDNVQSELNIISNQFAKYNFQYLINKNNTNVLYLRIDNHATLLNLNFGKIKIEDCFIKKEIYSINGNINELEFAINRLNRLNQPVDTKETFYDNINLYMDIFLRNTTNKISIATAIKYYESIKDNNSSTSDIESVNKVRSYIETMYEEKNNILKLLNDTGAVITDPNSYTLVLKNLYTDTQLTDLYSKRIEPTYTITIQLLDDDSSNISRVNIQYEKTSSNKYWINIDPKQSCSISEELRPRVLKQTTYTCTYLDPRLPGSNSISNNICPRFAVADPNYRVDKGGKEDLEFSGSGAIPDLNLDGNSYTYKIKDIDVINKKLSYKEKYSSIVGWTQQKIYRTMYASSNDIFLTTDTLDILIQVEEIYDVAISIAENISIADGLAQGIFKNDGSSDINIVAGIKNDSSCDIVPVSEGLGLLSLNGSQSRVGAPTRVYNIFNLDDVSELKVKFKKVPRILRGIDILARIFRYGAFGEYLQRQNGNPLSPIESVIGQGTLNNNFYQWTCLQADSENKLTETELPPIFRLFNEMIFRSFYGSVDNIELRKIIMKSYYAHDLIPFEFFTKIPPSPPQP